MKYNSQKLNSFLDNKVDKEEYDAIAQELVNLVLNGEKVSLAEESFACSIIGVLRTLDTNELAYDIRKIDSCKNYVFKHKYLLYFSDLNGNKAVRDLYGEISLDRKKNDTVYLDKEYMEWKSLIKTKTAENNLIGNIARETEFQIKKMFKYAEKRKLGSRYLDYLEKSLTLHGKYIYLTVLEAFQEHNKEELVFSVKGNNILIDSFSYVHTLFRHYSQSIKEHQNDKSFHFDENINHKDIPGFLLDLLNCYTNSFSSSFFNRQNLYFKFRGSYYAIWFRKIEKNIKGGLKVDYFRIQTLYPVLLSHELEKIKKLQSELTNCGFEFWH